MDLGSAWEGVCAAETVAQKNQLIALGQPVSCSVVALTQRGKNGDY